MRQDLTSQLKGLTYQEELPSDGWDKEKIKAEVEKVLGLVEFKGVSGITHKPRKEREEVVTEVYSMTAYTNPLNPDVYPGIRKMEAETQPGDGRQRSCRPGGGRQERRDGPRHPGAPGGGPQESLLCCWTRPTRQIIKYETLLIFSEL